MGRRRKKDIRERSGTKSTRVDEEEEDEEEPCASEEVPLLSQHPVSARRSSLADGSDQRELTFAERRDTQEMNLSRLLDWNDRYDNKIATLLTLATALFGALGYAVPSVNNNDTPWSVFVWVLVALGVSPLCGVIYHVSVGATPVLHKTNDIQRVNPSRLFFAQIAQTRLTEWYRERRGGTRKEYLDDLTFQEHVTSQIIQHKYKHLQDAYHCLWLSYFMVVPVCVVLVSGVTFSV